MRNFVHAFQNYHLLLSKGKEFLHDHVVHIMSTLAVLIKYTKKYVEFKQYSSSRVREIANIIKNSEVFGKSNELPKELILNDREFEMLEILKTVLAILVDAILWIPDIGVLEKYAKSDQSVFRLDPFEAIFIDPL